MHSCKVKCSVNLSACPTFCRFLIHCKGCCSDLLFPFPLSVLLLCFRMSNHVTGTYSLALVPWHTQLNWYKRPVLMAHTTRKWQAVAFSAVLSVSVMYNGPYSVLSQHWCGLSSTPCFNRDTWFSYSIRQHSRQGSGQLLSCPFISFIYPAAHFFLWIIIWLYIGKCLESYSKTVICQANLIQLNYCTIKLTFRGSSLLLLTWTVNCICT